MVKLIKKDKKKKGFTLIELVAVVAIIGILAALLIPKISGYIEDAKKTKVVDQARQVHMAVQTRNTKEDSQLGFDKSVTTALADPIVLKYMGITAADATAAFKNLKGDMTIEQCRKVAEGADFKMTNGVFVELITTATP